LKLSQNLTKNADVSKIVYQLYTTVYQGLHYKGYYITIKQLNSVE